MALSRLRRFPGADPALKTLAERESELLQVGLRAACVAETHPAFPGPESVPDPRRHPA